MLDGGAANHLAAEALLRCRRGDVEGGLIAYGRILRDGGANAVPVAVHARMLATAGLPEVAERLVILGFRHGADMSIHGAFGDAADRYELDKALDEYRGLFAGGRVGSLMVERYLALLVRAGDYDEVGRILDPAFIRCHDLTDGSDGGTTVDPGGVARALLDRLDTGTYHERDQAILSSTRIDHVHRIAEPAITDLMTAVRERVDRYRAELGAHVHAAMGAGPARYRLDTWSVISHDGGHALPHKHHRGWITCVFYAAVPEVALAPGEDQGALYIGRYDFIPAEAPGWRMLRFAPVPGRLVMMPSYALHWTRPLEQPGLRIAVAIDVCAEP
ncbi:putative 2OG-Fe(II) oxygenase [Tistrella mobilis]|uniref:putative 2OG-Fe(II) oxygenase n=1 Tax=Tistrella mobilis TaxID=171437 RepID=UPI003556E061